MAEEHSTREQLMEAFRQANASIALEGMHMTPEDLAFQQRVINGEWTFEEYHAYVGAQFLKKDDRV